MDNICADEYKSGHKGYGYARELAALAGSVYYSVPISSQWIKVGCRRVAVISQVIELRASELV